MPNEPSIEPMTGGELRAFLEEIRGDLKKGFEDLEAKVEGIAGAQTSLDKRVARVEWLTEQQANAQAAFNERLRRAEQLATEARRATSESSAHFDESSTGLSRILAAQREEQEKERAALRVELAEIKRTGSVSTVIRELRTYAIGAMLIGVVTYLIATKAVTPIEGGILFGSLGAAFAAFVKSMNDRAKAEKKRAETIPPPKE